MKLEDQLAPVELCKKLKELGVVQDACFSWLYSVESGIYSLSGLRVEALELLAKTKCIEMGIFSAYSVAELGLMLGSFWEQEIRPAYDFTATTEAEERANYLISAIESKQLTIEEVNNRLSPSSDK